MKRQRIIKFFTAAICLLLAGVLLLTLFMSAMGAETAEEYYSTTGDTDVRIELPLSCCNETYADYPFALQVRELSPEDDTDEFSFFESQDMFAGEKLLHIYLIEMVLSEEKDGYAAGTVINPTLFSENAVVYVPLNSDERNYKTLTVGMFDGVYNTLTEADSERVKVDGQRYLKLEGTAMCYVVVGTALDEAGEPVQFKFYEKGVIGFVVSYWQFFALAAAAIVFWLAFYLPRKKRAAAVSEQDAAAESEAEAEAAPEAEASPEAEAAPETEAALEAEAAPEADETAETDSVETKDEPKQ